MKKLCLLSLIGIAALGGMLSSSVETSLTHQPVVEQAEAAMNGGGTSLGVKCDGNGTPAACHRCKDQGCITVCNGYNSCIETTEWQNGEPNKDCSASDSCTTGGSLWGGGGGLYIQ
jgi:hypothetical protein